MSAVYRVTPAAADHLDEIADYTLTEWGADQMAVYLTALESRFQWLAANPGLGSPRPELTPGLRSYRQGSHVIFYMPYTERIDIIGVLHQSRDFDRHL